MVKNKNREVFGEEEEGGPGYLNYLLFDKNFKFVTAGATSITKSSYEKKALPGIAVEQPGYLITWLSYESDEPDRVFFDDFSIILETSSVIQQEDYSPFGLSFASYTAGDDNIYKYNGVERDPSTKNYEMMFRGYDPALGRFMQVDPLTHIIPGVSSYHFGFNNPVKFSDALGLMGNNEHYNSAPEDPFGRKKYDTWGNYIPPQDRKGGAIPSSDKGEFVPMYEYEFDESKEGYSVHSDPDGAGGFKNNRYVGHFKARVVGYKWVPIKILAYEGTNGGSANGGNWFRDHHYFEVSANGSFGAQASFVPTPKGPVPAPFIKGSVGAYVNIGSLVLGEFTANNKNGTSKYVIGEGPIRANQGLGIAFGIGSIEYTRNLVQGGGSENIINGSLFMGTLSAEFNFNTGVLDIGMMPGARWTLGVGIEGKIKNVLRFNVYG